MNYYEKIKKSLKNQKNKWLITGVAGFIGSNLLRELLELNQDVVGIDNFSTGKKENLLFVKNQIHKSLWKNFKFVNGDLNTIKNCELATKNCKYVLHQAALGSVNRSIKNPLLTNEANVNAFINILHASKNNNTEKVVFASSSSVYGDQASLPKIEEKIGEPLSTYAATKLINEIYAGVFKKNYDLNFIGLRYFNVFGTSQDKNGPYAAVIPRWIDSMINKKKIEIFGDGKTSRDFCYIKNAVQANILAATTKKKFANNKIYNIAVGRKTSLNTLFEKIRENLSQFGIKYNLKPIYRDFRPGDIRHSLANIDKAKRYLGYDPSHSFEEGLEELIKSQLSF